MAVEAPNQASSFSFQVFSIIVFACISSGGWFGHHCQMHDDTNACNYGVAIGVIAFLLCIGFLLLDAMFDNISNIQHRKYAVIADIGASGECNVNFGKRKISHLMRLWHFSSSIPSFFKRGCTAIQ